MKTTRLSLVKLFSIGVIGLGASAGSCEIAVNGDAGVTAADAGETATDAGETASDAGETPPEDAGVTSSGDGGTLPALEPCEVTFEADAQWNACRGAESEPACTSAGGTWSASIEVGMYCSCVAPDRGCACRRSSDCPFSICLVTENSTCPVDATEGTCGSVEECACLLGGDGPNFVVCN